jgi:uncharacterized protein (TIGR03067 family)
MKTRALMILAAGLFLAADDPKKDDAKKDLDALQGKWTCVSGEVGGKPTAEEDTKGVEFTVKDDTYTVKKPGDPEEKGTIKLDPTKKPKAIDFKILEGNDKGKSQSGVYELEGDTLKLCLALPGKERPKELSTKEGSMSFLIVFKRAKP